MPADGGTGEEGPAKLQRRGALRPGGSTMNRTAVKNDSIAEAVSEDDHGEGRRWEGGKGRDGEEREGGG